ncbi:Rrf2 family transcriptional regulator [bacterium]|nr:Rrf2 family transcriptional regulator [bacterium]
MRITALEEYGLRCMVLLAKTAPGDSLSLTEIGERERLSVPYVGKLLGLMKQAGLVQAERGRNGGYALARRADRISLKQVFDALGEPLFGVGHCEKFTSGDTVGDCVHLGDCTVRDVWFTFHALISDILERITLEDLASKKSKGRLNLLAMAGIDTRDWAMSPDTAGTIKDSETIQQNT